jgi:hypothetical protein
MEQWRRECAGLQRLLLDHSAIELSIPVLDLANKTVLPKTPQP